MPRIGACSQAIPRSFPAACGSGSRGPRARAVVAGLALLGLASPAATPKAWFKADSISVANGAAVTYWSDSTGNGHLATAGNAPTFSTTALNGHPAVHFNNSASQSMVFARPVQDDFTIMLLFKSAQGISTSNAYYSGAGLVSGEIPGVVADYGISLNSRGRVLAGTGNPDTFLYTSNGRNDNQPHVVTFTRVRSTGAISLYVDGAQTGTANATGGTLSLTAPANLCIGAQPGPLYCLTGDIAEIIVYEGAFSAGERTEQEGALKGKYGLSGGTAPATPTGLGASGATLSWTESTGAMTYQVERSASESGPFSVVASGLSLAEYTDPAAAAGGTYWFRVAATNGVGTSAVSGAVSTTLPVLPADGPVVINEIHYNGLNNAVPSDFVELYNFCASPADIGGWRLSGAVDFVFPAGTTIPAGGYLVVAADPATLQALWHVTALGPYTGALSSDGETLRLRNASDAVVAEVDYKPGFPWPSAADGGGASAELMNPTLDASLGSSWRSSVMTTAELSGEVASPGKQNKQYSPQPPPNIAKVDHSPAQPTSAAPIVVTARVTDPDGVGGVQLLYQIVAPGAFIPAYLPLPISNHLIDTSQARPANPDFENAANWVSVTMRDDGLNGDAVAGDGYFTAAIPAQAHRTLVRYRIQAADALGASVRAPFADDASANFACFVYDGVPAYQGVSATTLQTLPVYHFLTRKADYDQCVAYNSADQLTGNTPCWTFENWEAAIVFDGVVYDHIRYRLHGGNGRYYFTGKRGFRFFFNKGYEFQNRDQDGNPYPTKWNSMTSENCWENRGTLTYCLNELVNFHLWNTIGVPAPLGNWGHFRLIDNAAEQPDAWHGDFWGLIFLHEDYDGRFLDSHGLEKGNLYKLSRDPTDAPTQQRYQAPDSVSDGSDHYNIYNNLKSTSGEAFVRTYVNTDRWSYYHALCQAVRHYDYWATGDNNAAYYFQPDYTGQTNHLGKLWVLPNDVDATWGPTWNEGKDVVYAAIFDAPTAPGLYPDYFNAVREVRDLLWQPDQINPLIDQFAAVIAPFIAADSIRWKGAPSDAGNYNSLGGAGMTSLAALVQDMRNFAWVGGSWPGGTVGTGGRAAFLDTLQLGVSGSESSTMPATPVLTYTGPAGHPADVLRFASSAFNDPQGGGDFSALQWRVAEVTDATAPAYDPAAKLMLEWNASYVSEPITVFASQFLFPANACQPGHSYRVRARHRDTSGRWSHWSPPVSFIAGTATDVVPVVVSEFLYKPWNPSTEEKAAGFTDQEMFEYIELMNTGVAAVNLSGFQFTKGITFTFPSGTVVEPGHTVLAVANAAAFALRYGSGRPVAGTYTGNLKNSGEEILLTTAGGTPLVDFAYSDLAPWPTSPDTGAFSLVLINPDARPDPNVAANWRASALPGGAPGARDEFTYAVWARLTGAGSDPTADDDHDGLSNGLEYALAGDPLAASTAPEPVLLPLTVGGATADYLTLTFRRRLDAGDLTYHVMYSEDFASWAESPVLVQSSNHYDGTITELWRSPIPVAGRGFLRVMVTPP